METKAELFQIASNSVDLKKSTITSVKWLGFLQVIRQILSFGVSVILARLLMPRDFGLVGMSAIVVGFAGALSGLGISSAIIQKKDIDREHLNSAFWGGIGFGALIFLIIACVAPFASSFYGEPRLLKIVIVAALSFLISPIISVHVSLLQKELRFKEISIVTFVSFIVSAIVSITMAFSGFGVWSLVVGSLFVSPIAILLYWNRVKWKPQFEFKWIKLKELLRFGINIALQSMLNFATANYDYLIIGKFAGANALGVYTIAYHLMTKPLTQISTIISRVLFPAFSQIQDQDERIRKAYLKATTFLATVTFPIMSGIYLVADEFILFFYGEKWAGVIPILKILCIVGALKSIGTMVGSVQNAKGRPDIGLKWNIFVLIIYIPSFSFAAYHWGAIGVAWTLLILSFPLFIIIQTITNGLINLKFRDYVSSLKYPMLLSAAMILFVSLLKRFALIFTSEHYLILAFSAFIGVISYSLLLFFLNKPLVQELKSLIK